MEKDVELCQPRQIHICDGSDAEYRLLVQVLLNEGIIVPLPKYENWLV